MRWRTRSFSSSTGLLSGAMADILEVEDENERVRQRIEAGEVREDGEPLQEATYTPVSYTHLDVYKRQAPAP